MKTIFDLSILVTFAHSAFAGEAYIAQKRG